MVTLRTKRHQLNVLDESPTITGMYSLKYLNIFTKATSMCASVQIIQETGNRFLILKYNVANLGELKFYLATKVSEDLVVKSSRVLRYLFHS